MIEIYIPGYTVPLRLEYALFDFNGTLAKDGILIPCVKEKLLQLQSVINIRIITADTFGTCQEQLKEFAQHIYILPQSDNPLQHQALLKMQYMDSLDSSKCVCIGNGENDVLMLQRAALSICLIQEEGCTPAALMASRIICKSIHDAIDLLIYPQRIVATLRK